MPCGVRKIPRKEKYDQKANLLWNMSYRKEEEARKGRRGEEEILLSPDLNCKSWVSQPALQCPATQDSKTVKKRRRTEDRSKGTGKRREKTVQSTKNKKLHTRRNGPTKHAVGVTLCLCPSAS